MHFRTSTSAFFCFIVASLLLHSCDGPETNENKDFQQNLSSFNSTINKVDSTFKLMDIMQQKVEDVERERALGEISDEEAIEKLNHIHNTLGRQIASTSNVRPVNGLPAWARQLKLSEPTGMELDRDYSQATSENNDDEGFNSIILIYRGNYDAAITQAGIIAEKANIPMSQDYKDALMLSRKYDIESIKGASYMNFEIGSDNNPKYNISITVDDDGTLTINATDTDALMKQLGER